MYIIYICKSYGDPPGGGGGYFSQREVLKYELPSTYFKNVFHFHIQFSSEIFLNTETDEFFKFRQAQR